MPRGDGTGPQGKGAASGWGQGKCKAGNRMTSPNGSRGKCCPGANRGRGWGNVPRNIPEMSKP
ncbi:MAG: DUF5320 domain-containing protein [Syntrophomonas sp.]